MKSFTKKILIFFLLYSGLSSFNHVNAQATVSFQVFYDELSPYGTWVDNSDYGYVWIPNAGAGFEPYSTNGYWVFTDQGWTWVSNYSWGWAPFHYGRWYNDPYYGPVWVPDNEWGPGWVTWRRSNDYYGWAPIEPGISISIAYGSGYNVPYNRWRFVPCRDFGRTDIHNYYVNSSNNITIIKNTTVIINTRTDPHRNVSYHGGPDRGEAEKHAGKKFDQVVIKDGNKPGHSISKDQYEIYRPQVQRNNDKDHKPAPAKVAKREEVKAKGTQPNNTPEKAKENPAPQRKETPRQPNTPKQENPKQNTPKQENPKQNTPRQENPKQNTPKQENPKQNTPRQENPKQNTPRQENPKQNTPKQENPKQNTPKQENPKQNTPRQENPKPNPQQNTPKQEDNHRGNEPAPKPQEPNADHENKRPK